MNQKIKCLNFLTLNNKAMKKQISEIYPDRIPAPPLSPKEMEKKSCFNCERHSVCFVNRRIMDATSDVSFLNINGSDLLGKWVDIFESIANCCFKYEPIH